MKKLFLMLSAALLLLCTAQEKVSAQQSALSPVVPATPATPATPPVVGNKEERTPPQEDRNEKEKVNQKVEMREQGITIANPIFPSTVVKVDGRTVFVIRVLNATPGLITWIDPPVAVGYDYSVEKGPKVTGVELPTGIGDDKYDLWMYNEQADTYTDSGVEIEGGALYQFNEPISKFSIRGIESDAGLDPGNGTAFPTGLRFEKTGRAIVNMTSIENEM